MNPMLTTLLTVAAASVVGSLHCAAMCGGLVSFTCGTSERPRLAQVAYHSSRLAVYSGLGAVAGYLGQSLNQRVDIAGYQNLTGLVTGGAMVGWALFSLTRRWQARLSATSESKARVATAAPGERLVPLSPRKPKNALGGWFAKIHALPSVLRGALLGLTSAVLPCGWLYAFVTAAAGQGAPGAGALLMGAFWLGTLPMLIGLGGLVSLLGGKAQRMLPQLSLIVLLALGLGTIAFRQPGGRSDMPAAGDAASPHSCH